MPRVATPLHYHTDLRPALAKHPPASPSMAVLRLCVTKPRRAVPVLRPCDAKLPAAKLYDALAPGRAAVLPCAVPWRRDARQHFAVPARCHVQRYCALAFFGHSLPLRPNAR